MGRGLSDLQRYVLARAGEQERVYYADILEGYFGWRPRRPLRRYGLGACANDTRRATGQ